MAGRREMLVRGALVAAVTASVGLFAASADAPEAPLAAPVAAPVTARVAAPVAAPAQRAPAKSETLRIDLLRRNAQQSAGRDVFAAHSWQPPPAPPRAVKPQAVVPEPPPEPAPPAAPPLPFTFLGAFESAGGKQVFYLVEGDKVHAVSEGEVVNGLYRIESVGTEEMVLVYLPLDIRQALALGTGK
jgi:hypothetical protein